MTVEREQLHKLIDSVPKNKMDEVYRYLKSLSDEPNNNDHEEAIIDDEAIQYTLDTYNEAFRGLKER